MAKTTPIGVRFDEELLSRFKSAGITVTPQKALSIYESFFEQNFDENISRLKSGIKPEDKKLNKEPQPKTSTKLKTLDDLKKMCPSGLDQFERSAWIREKRIEYGI